MRYVRVAISSKVTSLINKLHAGSDRGRLCRAIFCRSCAPEHPQAQALVEAIPENFRNARR
jgi:hypothetical protein